MLWKQLDLNPGWPVFVGVMVYRKNRREVRRFCLPHEHRAVANGMSQCFSVGGNRGKCGQDLLERFLFSVTEEVPGISNA